MSFSKTAKDEIIKKNIFKNEAKSLLQGVFLTSGSLIISGGELSFVVSNENESVIEFVKQKLIETFSGIEIDIVKVVKSFKNKERFELSTSGAFNENVLTELGIIEKNQNGEFEFSDVCDKSFMKNENTMTAFLAGAFLGSGSLSVPCETNGKRKYGYHFEIDLTSREQAELVAEIMTNFDIFPKIVERNDLFVVYLKNSDTICDVLGLLGASKLVLDLTNDRVSRDMNNMTNRQINCISANIDKTVNAALKQLKAIETIRSTIGIEQLPEPLAEAALSRLANPEGSLNDLLQTLDKKISKGALAQRFNKIIKLSEELGENDDK
jgi:hypothetical protein